MSGIYLHIPFCKQACHYCDFHFSTSLKKKSELIDALCGELVLRKDELKREVQTIYLGGGTPSLLTADELQQIFKTIYEHYKVVVDPEITLEANPDDLLLEGTPPSAIFEAYKKAGVNRLSIGVQSFFEEDLTLMNRAHNAKEAWECIKEAKRYFENISIDLIYGIPGMDNERWLENINKALELEVPHVSCYALTVEPKTALKSFIEKGIIAPVDDAVAKSHHTLLVETLEQQGYDNYEFSNFGKKGWYSQNNMAYWQGKPYLGIGPSAHSYDGDQRSWNVANNTKYIQAISKNELPLEREQLSKNDRYNEYVMTRLRTQWGVSLGEVSSLFGERYKDYLLKQAEAHITARRLLLANDRLTVSKTGKFLSDGIASDLFMLGFQ